jgi:hypothetical protein
VVHRDIVPEGARAGGLRARVSEARGMLVGDGQESV